MTRLTFPALVSTSLAVCSAFACSAGDPDGSNSGDGDGDSINLGDGDGDTGGDGDGGDGDDDIVVNMGTGGTTDDMEPMEDCDATLELIVRDFQASHVDFEMSYSGRDDIGCGMVMPDLLIGDDGTRTPVFQAGIGTAQRHITDGIISCTEYGQTAPPPGPEGTEIESATSFNDWYSDVAGVNQTILHTLTLTEDPTTGTYFYDSGTDGFYPIEGQGFPETHFGHNGEKNFHFTTEAHVRFGYMGGERFTFSGDDDMWIFVNGKLALDLGGLHQPLTATIDFDAQAAALGIEKGKVYNMDIFHAERHTGASNYRVETNISCFEIVEVPTVVVR